MLRNLRFLILFSLFEYVRSSCSRSEYHRADEQENFLSHSGKQLPSQDCPHTHFVSPEVGFLNGYFLKIKWYSMKIPDKMPDCKDTYIEVFLTRIYKSIGRFCLENGKLFNMYSYDGYAKIIYNVGKGNKETGYRLSYQMLNDEKDYLGAGSACFNTLIRDKVGNIFTSRWPRGDYYATTYPCTHLIKAGGDTETKIIFMDVDLARTTDKCPANGDSLEIRGSDASNPSFDGSSKFIRKIQCDGITTVTTSYQSIYVRFYRSSFSIPRGHRGFVAGYIVYAKKKGLSGTQIAGIVTGLLGILVIAAVAVWRCKQHMRRKAAIERQHQHHEERQHQQPPMEENLYESDRVIGTSEDRPISPPKYTYASTEPAPPYLQPSAAFMSLPNEPPPSYQDVLSMEPIGNQSQQRGAGP